MEIDLIKKIWLSILRKSLLGLIINWEINLKNGQ